MEKKKEHSRARGISKKILLALAVAGGAALVMSDPYFVSKVLRGIKNEKKKNQRILTNGVYYLKSRGVVLLEQRKGLVYISLTEKGQRIAAAKAAVQKLRDLEIKSPPRWDGKWRIVLFDISANKNRARDAFRYFLKQSGFYQLQKSVWVHPADCREEFLFLKNFFKLSEAECRLVVAETVGEDETLRKVFKLK